MEKTELEKKIMEAIARQVAEMRDVSDLDQDKAESDLEQSKAEAREAAEVARREREAIDPKQVAEEIRRELAPLLRTLPMSKVEDLKESRAIDRETLKRLMERPTRDDAIRRVQRAHDDLLLARKIAQAQRRSVPQGLVIEYEEALKEAGFRATTFSATGAGTGDEWTFDRPSADLIDYFNPLSDIAMQFDSVRIPDGAESLTLPRLTGLGTVKTISETTTDTATQPVAVSNPGTAQVKHTVGKHAARFYVSREATEDQIVSTIPVLRDAMRRAFMEAQEEAIISGDSASALDSGMTAGDHLSIFDGLRDIAINTLTGATLDMSALTAPSDVNELRKLMGKWGVDVAQLRLILPYNRFFKWLKDAEFKTLDNVGPRATLLTGQMAAVAGIPVFVSSKFRQDLNATGTYDGVTTTKHAYLLVNVAGFKNVLKRDIEIRVSDELRLEFDQLVIFGTRRIGFQAQQGTEKTVSYGYNLAN